MGFLSYFSCCVCCFIPLEREKPLPRVTKLDDVPSELSFQKAVNPDLFEKLPLNIQTTKKIRFVCTSDTHDRMQDMKIPDGDVLLHAGDFSVHKNSLKHLRRFNEVLGTLPHKQKYVIAGNHEVCLENNPENESLLTNAVYVRHQRIDLFDGAIVLFMSSHRPGRGCCYKAEAFGVDYQKIGSYWDEIPEGTDIVVTHHPAYGIADYESAGHIGCPKLLEALERVKPKVHIAGHVHGMHGVYHHPFGSNDEEGAAEEEEKHAIDEDFLTSINAAALNDHVNLLGPIVFDFYLK